MTHEGFAFVEKMSVLANPLWLSMLDCLMQYPKWRAGGM